MKNDRIVSFFNLILILFFVGIISLPLIINLITVDEKFSDNEKRVLTSFPDRPDSFDNVLKYPANFEKYFNDHFGFREKLIYRYHRELRKKFGIAGSPHVLQGKGNWLYYIVGEMLDDFMGKKTLSAEQILKWREQQQERSRWLEKHDIKYVTFSPPNKQAVYPETMPEGFLTVKGQSRMEQLRIDLSEEPVSFFVDVHEGMTKEKSKKKLYYETDTHWNTYGAYLAFKQVMKKVQELYPNENFTVDFSFHRKLSIGLGGDLARMLMIHKKVRDTYPKVKRYKKCAKRVAFDVAVSGVGAGKHHKPRLESCSRAKLKAIIFCDSFITYIRPYFSENFSEVLYLRKGYSQQNIEELLESFKPDIVIEELVERNYFKSVTEDKKNDTAKQ